LFLLSSKSYLEDKTLSSGLIVLSVCRWNFWSEWAIVIKCQM